jgi:hypothetical protein
LEIVEVGGIGDGSDGPDSPELSEEARCGASHISVRCKQDDFGTPPRRDVIEMTKNCINIGTPRILDWDAGEIGTFRLTHHGGEGEDLQFPTTEGLPANSREIRQALVHGTADIKIEVNDRKTGTTNTGLLNGGAVDQRTHPGNRTQGCDPSIPFVRQYCFDGSITEGDLGPIDCRPSSAVDATFAQNLTECPLECHAWHLFPLEKVVLGIGPLITSRDPERRWRPAFDDASDDSCEERVFR